MASTPERGSDRQSKPPGAPEGARGGTPAHSEVEHFMLLSKAFRNAARAPRPSPKSAAPAAERPARARTSYVVNRRGEQVPVRFDRITERNEDLRSNPDYGAELVSIDSPSITAQVVSRFRNGMSTRELDAETSAICIQLATHHSDYEWLAARIHISDLHKRTPASLRAMVELILGAAPDRDTVRLSDEFVACVTRGAERIEARLAPERDYALRFFGYQTIARSYLLRPLTRREESTLLDTQIMERPQHLYMRMAIGLFVCQPDRKGHLAPDDVFAQRLEAAFELYDALSLQRVSHATPTIINSATRTPQLSSCFQVATGDDMDALYDSVKSMALISKWSGGISLWLHNVRAEGALIKGTGGLSSGVKRYAKVLNDVQLHANQGGNRKGAFAIYLSVDHADIIAFLTNARPKGEESLKEVRSADLKYAIWVPDLFMEALEAQLADNAKPAGVPRDPAAGDWYLFSPDEAPGLHLVWGEEYRTLYAQYVSEKRYRRKVKAGDIVAEAYRTWAMAGVPYVLFKDHVNRKSNMKNVAPICSSNLCAEILIPSWSNFDAPTFNRFHPENVGGEYGVCNLAALCLESFLVASAAEGPGDKRQDLRGSVALDYKAIIDAAALLARALNRVIDLNYYPSDECGRSNRRHRPIGIGIMGLADVFARLKLAYGSPEALRVARAIAACVYYGALCESARLAGREGSYASFEGSPVSQGRLQPDLWAEQGHLAAGWAEEIAGTTGGAIGPEGWPALRGRVRQGVRNAYVTAYMPTATTSNIVGQNECFEPFTSNMYVRKTLAGEFFVVNRHLMAELGELGLWDDQMRREVLAAAGSVQGISRIPSDVQRRYRTAREIHPSLIVRTAAAMGPFICQSMSMNLMLDSPNLPKILRFLMEGWKAGLKCGLYYLHTKPKAGTQKTSVRATPGSGAISPAKPPIAPSVAFGDAAGEVAGELCTDRDGCTSCAL